MRNARSVLRPWLTAIEPLEILAPNSLQVLGGGSTRTSLTSNLPTAFLRNERHRHIGEQALHRRAPHLSALHSFHLLPLAQTGRHEHAPPQQRSVAPPIVSLRSPLAPLSELCGQQYGLQEAHRTGQPPSPHAASSGSHHQLLPLPREQQRRPPAGHRRPVDGIWEHHVLRKQQQG